MKKKLIIIITIIILTIINLFLVFKKDTNIVEKNKVSKIERKEFSILKEQTYNGKDWELSNDTTFPEVGYLLNNEQSKCYGYNDEPITPIPVTQELTKGSIDGRVTIESSKTIYCELYFDLDNKLPEVNEFSITGKTSGGTDLNNGYTYGLDVTYKGNWLDEDVVQYCISDNNQSCSNWTEISNKDITVTSPSLTNGDGEKTMYIYLKDKANNVSEGKSTTITVDRTAPVVKTFTLTGTADEGQQLSDSSLYTHTKNIKYSASITETNIAEYCVYESSCSYQTTTSISFSKVSYTLTNTEGSHSVKIRVKDKAGNESDVSTQSIKLDKTNPTATISKNTQDTSSITVTVGYSGTDSIIARQCRVSSGSWVTASSNGSCTISNLSDGTQYTIQARVRDASGRWNTTYPSVSVTTDGKKYPASTLLSNPPKGLTGTDCGGMKRFEGNCDAAKGGCDGIVDNFVCFGYTDESDCRKGLSGNEYIYRIIGISSTWGVKLIKNKELSKKYSWRLSELVSGNLESWDESNIFEELNYLDDGFFASLSSVWQNKIIDYWWPIYKLHANDNGYGLTGEEACYYNEEKPVIQAKVGLMLLDDYFSSACSFNGNCGYGGDINTTSRSWLRLSMNGSSSFPSSSEEVEWTMQFVTDLYEGYVWSIRNGTANDELFFGGSSDQVLTVPRAIRPVFFLSPDALFSSGAGTSTDPFILAK